MRIQLLAAFALLLIALSGCAESGSDQEQTDDGDDQVDPGDDGQGDDQDGNVTGDINATNTPPTAELSADVLNGTAPLMVNFTIDGSDADGDNLTWELSTNGTAFANGTTLPGQANATFEAAGNFTVSLTISDGLNVSTANVTISVAEAAPTGPCGGEPEPCIVHEGDWVTVWSDGRCDAAGTILPLDDGPGYIHDRNTGTPGTGLYDGAGTWAFEETNGIPGLQLTQAGSLALDEKDPIAVEWNCQNGDGLIF